MPASFHIPELDLIPLDAETLAELLADPAAYLKKEGDSGALKAQIVAVAGQTRDFQTRSGAQPPWIGYLAQVPKTHEIVGACSYKGDPTATDGTVEIAYFTFPEFEGGGYATGMAQELLARAFAEAVIMRVIAYTQTKRGSSARVLEKVGLTCTGQVDHPEDGKVWRWELSR
ncbi:MAG: GNAT family N-acetyltransferase [Verrucomicrobia bacterium]|nr:GNAT family N-acetyltransferase [Verrucomicrobiota bacterium]